MSKQEPHPLRKTRMLRVQTASEADERASTGVRSQDRGRVLAAERIARALFQRASEEATVEVEQRCDANCPAYQIMREETSYSLISLMAKAMYRCIVSSIGGWTCGLSIGAPPNPGTLREGGM